MLKRSKSVKPIDEACKWFSLFIKLRDSDWKGQGQCITCQTWLQVPSGQAHAGHYHHGKYKKTYFNEKNVHLQCRSCNFFKDGARDIYAFRLEEKYGAGILQELMEQNKKYSWKKKELEGIIETYKGRVMKYEYFGDKKE